MNQIKRAPIMLQAQCHRCGTMKSFPLERRKSWDYCEGCKRLVQLLDHSTVNERIFVELRNVGSYIFYAIILLGLILIVSCAGVMRLFDLKG